MLIRVSSGASGIVEYLEKGQKKDRWFDRDDPSFTGDYETLNDLRKEGNTICPNPIATEC